jgi:hypothetical protein
MARSNFPAHGKATEVPLLVDTGADRTVLSPVDGLRLAAPLGITTRARLAPGVSPMFRWGNCDLSKWAAWKLFLSL